MDPRQPSFNLTSDDDKNPANDGNGGPGNNLNADGNPSLVSQTNRNGNDNSMGAVTDEVINQLIATVARARDQSNHGQIQGQTDIRDDNRNFLNTNQPSTSTNSHPLYSNAMTTNHFAAYNTAPGSQGHDDVNALQAAAYLLSTSANSMWQALSEQQQAQQRHQQQLRSGLFLLQQQMQPNFLPSALSQSAGRDSNVLAALLAGNSQASQATRLPTNDAVLNMLFTSNNNNSTPRSTQGIRGEVQAHQGMTSAPPPAASAAMVQGLASQEQSELTNRPSIPLVMEYDEQVLNEYQCLLRKQIELFENKAEDVTGKAQGRNTPVKLGQVGIRCRHCVKIPKSARPKGSVYYSRKLAGMYQIAQNMAKVHFGQDKCRMIPDNVKNRLLELQRENRKASGGRDYWVHCLQVVGVYEDGNILRLKPVDRLVKKKT